MRNPSYSEPLTIDPETGLPALPEGFAWNVRSTGGSNTVVVEIYYLHEYPNNWWENLCRMKPASDWRDAYSHGEYAAATKESILEAATKVYMEGHERYLKEKDVDELVGLYPPKSIL